MKHLELREYQGLIRDFILDNKRCAIWSFMGSGKTAATLSAVDIIKALEPDPVLVIAPPIPALDVWPGEVEKWHELSHLKPSCVLGGVTHRIKALKARADFYTINNENVPWLAEYLGDEWPFKTIVFDESSKLRGARVSFQTSKLGKTYIRSGGAKRALALAHKAFKASRFIELTGTPASNGLQNLWGQFWYIDGGKRLGKSYSAYEKRWFSVGYDGYSVIPHPHSEKEITSRVADVCLSLHAEDWFDLEKPIERNVFVHLPPKAFSLYKQMETDFFIEVKKHPIESPNTGSMYNRCAQIANGAIYVDKAKNYEVIHDEKIKALKTIIEETYNAPMLVVYVYQHELQELKKAFPRAKVLDGKRETIRAWNAGRIPQLLLHAASAGHGLNLQDGGNIVVYYGIDWDLELHEQVLERIGPVRQAQSGHKRNVFVYYILAKDTLDIVKRARLVTKATVQESIRRAINDGYASISFQNLSI